MKTKIIFLMVLAFILVNLAVCFSQEEQLKEDELAGISLGFSMDQVKKLLGTPPRVSELETDKPDTKEIVWEYKNRGIKILFRNNYAEVIIIKAPCNLPTPRGLRIGDTWKRSLEVYKYCSAYVQNLGYEIGIIFTLEQGIKLSIAVPSDREEIGTISIWREK